MLDRGSVVRRIGALVAAWLWAGAVVVLLYRYHVAQPTSPWAEVNGHTYFTHPPAQTLAQRDRVSAEIMTIAVCVAVGVGTADLVVRLGRRRTVPGVAALAAGGSLLVFSLFGLLRGLAGIGTIGLLVILSGLPMKARAVVDGPTSGPDPPSRPAATASAPRTLPPDPDG